MQALRPSSNIIASLRRRRKMLHIDLGDTRIELNKEGFVVDPSIWTRELAEHMARRDGLTLTEDHWEIINYLRSYFERYQIAPMISILAKEIGKTGPDKGGVPYLFRLFPDGPARQACKYAGLPKATGCI
jgi:tRNA 2-thiouridine synthesizing protein E